MAHFAKIRIGNIVEQVVVVSNDIATTEQAGIEFLKSLYGEHTNWKQTSYNNNIRKNFASIDYKYDETRDAFIPQKPFTSWVLNENTCQWEAPIPMPQDDNKYSWNESTLTWDIVEV
jgi:hypothetical protein